MNKEDRRESKRISYVCEVECEGAGLNNLATRINDLSATGAFIDSMTCYAPGTHLRLRFRVHDAWIETAAEVRYTMPQMGMGVRFLGLEPVHLAAIESLIDGKSFVPPPTIPDRGAESGNQRNAWKTPDMLIGNFAIVSMFDVIQLIENNRLSGSLSVVSPGANGEIHFNDGLIVDAHSGKAGLEGLKCFLDVTEGSFEFRTSDTHYPSTIEATNNMSLMLDLLRVIDEDRSVMRET